MPRPDIPLAVQASLNAVLDYLWHDEETHWLENGRPTEHIFYELELLEEWLNNGADF